MPRGIQMGLSSRLVYVGANLAEHILNVIGSQALDRFEARQDFLFLSRITAHAEASASSGFVRMMEPVPSFE
jgi:hypothetical protein